MAYVDTTSGNRRTATLTLVAALHVAAGYALVTGLAGHGFTVIEERLTAFNTPIKQPEPPPPIPQPSQKVPEESQITIIKDPVLDLKKPAEFIFVPIPLPSEGAGTSELGTAAFPTPSPRPSPLFTPRSAQPRGNPGLWVTPNDYPTSDLRMENEGITRFEVRVGTDGKVASCSILRSSGHPGLDAATCDKVTRRARFDPASDETGAKVAGSYSNSVKWQMPKD